MGLDFGFDYETLAAAQAALLAVLSSWPPTPTQPSPWRDRLLPGGGAIVAAVATASGREPVVMGKPEMGMADRLLAEVGGRAATILFVGDKLSTDILMASRAGMRSALMLTGVTERSELDKPGSARPDFVLESLESLPSLLDTLGAGTAAR